MQVSVLSDPAFSYFSSPLWGHANRNPASTAGTTTPSRLAQLRSWTPTPTAATKQVTKSTSTPHLAAVAANSPPLFGSESSALNTIPDPRSPTPSSGVSRKGSTDSSAHPDLSAEVSALSTKLINAINIQTALDDTLQHTRHELDQARERVAQLENAAQEHADSVQEGFLVERSVFEKMEEQLSSELAEEKKRRVEAEKDKRKVDAEVEALTTALFEQANGVRLVQLLSTGPTDGLQMVAAARKDAELADKRSDQLRQQLGDSEVLLASQQAQLQDLKSVVHQLSSDRDDTNTHPSTPSTPAVVAADRANRVLEAANLTPTTPASEDTTPNPPLHFAHLIHPVLRADLNAFKDFQEMLKSARSSAPSSRAASGNYSSLSVLGLTSLANASTTSLPSAVKSPSLGSGSNTSPRESFAAPNLKDEKFFKRALAEDIEPTLRLDLAPGIAWLARRSVLSSIISGSLVVEPHPPVPKFRGPVFVCALCGENRKGETYSRKHRFRVSESDDSPRYPLCEYCLGRVRTTCDFISFLRMVAAGHWRGESDQERKSAWEESVRLRERMFWTRIGGGVVPAFVPLRDSPRSPTLPMSGAKERRTSDDSELAATSGALTSVTDATHLQAEPRMEDPFRSPDMDETKHVSIGRTVLTDPQEDEHEAVDEAAEAQLQREARLATQAAQGPSSPPGEPCELHHRPWRPDKEQRLSIAIPGGYDD